MNLLTILLQQQGGGMSMIIMMVAIFAIMYFFMIRPQNKKQKEIANLLGISQQYYSEYEKGNRTIPIQHLITLSKFYGTSIDYLVGLADVNLYSKYHKKTS